MAPRPRSRWVDVGADLGVCPLEAIKWVSFLVLDVNCLSPTAARSGASLENVPTPASESRSISLATPTPLAATRLLPASTPAAVSEMRCGLPGK